MEQNNHPNPEAEPRHIPTPEEIARAEAEAVRALQRGEALPGRTEPADAPPKPDWSDVPYVDDAEAAAPAPAPVRPRANADDEDDDAPAEPSDLEKRIAAIPEDKWNLYQILGGAAVGLIAVALLTFGSEDLGTWSLVLAAVLALVAPRYLERWGGRKLPRARMAMVISMAVALVAFFIIAGMRNGFQMFDK